MGRWHYQCTVCATNDWPRHWLPPMYCSLVGAGWYAFWSKWSHRTIQVLWDGYNKNKRTQILASLIGKNEQAPWCLAPLISKEPDLFLIVFHSWTYLFLFCSNGTYLTAFNSLLSLPKIWGFVLLFTYRSSVIGVNITFQLIFFQSEI